MGYNIEWADPQVTECWSYQGRLYRSFKKAEQERDYRIKCLTQNIQVHEKAGRDTSCLEQRLADVPAIYKVTWAWEACDEKV